MRVLETFGLFANKCNWFAGSLLTAILCVPQAGYGATINMPAGSTVWMEFRSDACGTGSDCVGSNQAGSNPPNGIPTTTFSTSTQTVTGFAEVKPDQVRTYLSSNFTAFMFASFQDTYTIGGSTSALFDIPVQLHVTGFMSTVPVIPGVHQLIAPSVIAEIGTFDPNPNLSGTLEGSRVSPFAGCASCSDTQDLPSGIISTPTPTSVPVDVTASYVVKGMSVGSVFDLAFGVNSAFARGEIDLLGTAAISFILPDGVFLTSALGGQFGAQGGEVPIPAALPLFATVLGGAGLLAWRRRRKAPVIA